MSTFGSYNALHALPPLSGNATFDTINGNPVQDFAQSVASGVFFLGILPQGASWATGLKVNIIWLSALTSGTVVWGAAFEDCQAQAMSADHWLAQVTATGTAGAANVPIVTSISIPNANLGTLAAEKVFRLQIQRLGTGTLAGLAQLLGVSVEAY